MHVPRPPSARRTRPLPLGPCVVAVLALSACAGTPTSGADGADTADAASAPTGATESGGAPGAAGPFRPASRHWGAMREVLRDGKTEGRVLLRDVVGPNTIAVGALAGLAAEITIVNGDVHLAEVRDASASDGLVARAPASEDAATLLVASDVDAWSELALPALADLATLEATVATLAAEQGLDVAAPFPFRVEGEARDVRLHVLDHSCPIASPDGPAPWRFEGPADSVSLVGFHATDAGGVLTHHGQSQHTHAVLHGTGVSGHLDDIELAEGARLYLPARGPGDPR